MSNTEELENANDGLTLLRNLEDEFVNEIRNRKMLSVDYNHYLAIHGAIMSMRKTRSFYKAETLFGRS